MTPPDPSSSLEALARYPRDARFVERVRDGILADAPDDPVAVREACAALVAHAGSRPTDEPVLADRAARTAAEAARRCLDALAPGAARDPAVAAPLFRVLGNALRLCGPGEDRAAREALERAVGLARNRGPAEQGLPWYDLGLLHKVRGRFAPALDCMLRARARLGERRPIEWNIAICATALGQGDLAAGTWRKLGIAAEVSPESGMPFVEGLPPAEVRVPARGLAESVPAGAAAFERVWVVPLSPVHGVVQTPTEGDCPVDWGDLVLWDGAPVAVARRPEGPVPCFALLKLLRRSPDHRLEFVASAEEAALVQRLAEVLPEGVRLQVARARVEAHCPRCSTGAPLEPHEHGRTAPLRGKLLVPPGPALPDLAERLAELRHQAGLSLAVPALYRTLGDGAAEAQERERWSALAGPS